MTVEFRILGPVEVLDGAGRVELRAAKVRALLAALVIHRNQVVSADHLVEALWGGDPPQTATNGLQGYVAKLRRILGPGLLSTRAPGYVLTVKPEASDAGRFEALVTRGQTARNEGRAEEAAELLGEALALWRGTALGEFADHPFAQAEAARLEERRLVAIEELIETELARGRHTEVVGRLQALVGAHPLRERLWGQLMVALYRSGRGAEALQAYSAVFSRLGEELGIEPGPALRRLQEDLLLQRPELDRPPMPPPRHEVPTNLPTARSSFVGRHQELAELGKLLAAPGLVTVVGPGGVGKTRLAIEAARSLFAPYADGVWLVELAPLVDPTLVPAAAAAALGVREESDRPLTATLASHLAGRRSVVVLDNCEHLVEGAARLADALLKAAPHLAVLATSREPLLVEGETLWRAQPLAVAEEDDLAPEALLGYDAVRLFCERAQSAEPGFAFDATNAPAVAQLCRRLDGIPLAIELAAARSRALSPAQIADRLDDRFRLLTTGARPALARQQTLQAAVDWSHELLTGPERVLFRRLSVFRGFTLDAAEAVCPDQELEGREVPGLLGDLVDRSLVLAQPSGDTTLRYSLLETLREYAAARLGESGEEEALAGRHLHWSVSLAEGVHGQLFGADEARTLRMLDVESANFRLALRRASDEGLAEMLLRLAIALSRLWKVRALWTEGGEWLEAGLSSVGEASASLRAKALAAAAVLANERGDFAVASRLSEHAVELARHEGDRVSAAEALHCLHDVARSQGEFERAESLLEECLTQWRTSGAVHGYVCSFPGALSSGATSASMRGRHRKAAALSQEALAVASELGIARARASALFRLGVLAEAQGQLAEARRFLAEAALTFEHLQDASLADQSYMHSVIAFDEGDLDGAVAGFQGVMMEAVDRGDPILLIKAIEGIGRVAAQLGDLRRAATLFGAASARRLARPLPVPPVDRPWYDAVVSRLRDRLGDLPFETAWNRGGAMSTQDVVHLAGAGRHAPLRATSGRPHPAPVGRE